jgi:hypothetical protein
MKQPARSAVGQKLVFPDRGSRPLHAPRPAGFSAARPTMRPRPAGLVAGFAVLLVVGSSLSAQELTTPPAEPPPRRLFVTEAQLERARVIAEEQARRRDVLLRADVDDDVVLLEPYIVEGDSSLVLARIRRLLDAGVNESRRFFVGLPDAARQELRFARRAQDEFFRPGTAGRPHDAPNFDGIDLLRLPGRLKSGNFRNIFRAPDEQAGE